MRPSITSPVVVRRPSAIVLFRAGLVIVTSAFLVGPQSAASADDFSIHELLTKRFPHRISDDIYLDPCKAGKQTNCKCIEFSAHLCCNFNSRPSANYANRVCSNSAFLRQVDNHIGGEALEWFDERRPGIRQTFFPEAPILVKNSPISQ